jgi:hypothetical protein
LSAAKPTISGSKTVMGFASLYPSHDPLIVVTNPDWNDLFETIAT